MARAVNTTAADAKAAASGFYIEWGPVIAGGILATALSVVLLQFGSGIGFTAADSVRDDGSASWIVLVAGLWVIWVAFASSALGGYVAGRMRTPWAGSTPTEVEFRDGAHGLIVWGVATIAAGVGLALISALSASGIAATGLPDDASPEMRAVAANASIIFAFGTAAGAALGAAAAWWSATVGGEHRDKGYDHADVLPAAFRTQLSAKK